MFKKSIFIPLIGSLLILTGCEKNLSSYNKMMDDGKAAIVNNDYEKAEGMFDLALEKKSDDKEAKILKEQTEKLINAVKMQKEKNSEAAKKLCNEIDSMDSKSDVVKNQANKLKQELDSLKNLDNKEESSNQKSKTSKSEHGILADKKYKYIAKLGEIQDEIDSYAENYETTPAMKEGEATALKLWDSALNEIYQEIKENTNPKEMEIIKQSQLDWIKYRDKEAEKESKEAGNGSLSGIAYDSALAELTKQRCYELVNTYMK
ncbi:lysozyme inhibitor LprI family protein [Paraclostridium tenue]|uniref:Lysozyme inhibitor LprI-like N-terminal domain-containing protein n=1 Tax=Paraclostridium tenue TaxID=1737 RepID=A0ABN1M4J1_9FIRM